MRVNAIDWHHINIDVHIHTFSNEVKYSNGILWDYFVHKCFTVTIFSDIFPYIQKMHYANHYHSM